MDMPFIRQIYIPIGKWPYTDDDTDSDPQCYWHIHVSHIHTYIHCTHIYVLATSKAIYISIWQTRERKKNLSRYILTYCAVCVVQRNEQTIYLQFHYLFLWNLCGFFFFISPNIFALPYISQSLSISHYERSLPSWCFNKKRNSFFGCSVLAMIGICVQFCKGISVAWNDLHCSAKL